MPNDRLYKYLDADGGLMMLYYGTLMFTNATQLNDPFDCHPAYTHFIYLGEHLKEKKNAEAREKIIKAARKCNPDIKIYQMTIDPEAFRLKEEQI
jgi:hypothetical protein